MINLTKCLAISLQPSSRFRTSALARRCFRCYSSVRTRRFHSSKRTFSFEQTSQQKGSDAEQLGVIKDFERALFTRLEQAGFKRSRRFYWSVAIVFSATAVGGYLYLFPQKLRQQVVEEVSTVASQSLEDEKIVLKAGQLSKDVLSGILNDDETKVVASEFVKDIIASDAIKDAAVETILGLLNDPKVLSLLRTRLTEIILSILQHDNTRQIVISQVNSILHHESVQDSLQELLNNLVSTPEVQALMADFFRDVLASDTVKDQGKLLGQQVTTDVITSKEIQEQAGNALWSAVKFSVIPNMFKGKSKIITEANGEETLDEKTQCEDFITEEQRLDKNTKSVNEIEASDNFSIHQDERLDNFFIDDED